MQLSAKIGGTNQHTKGKTNLLMNRIEKLLELLEAAPGDSFLQHALGLEYLKLGDREKALQFFTELLQQNPGYVGTYYHLGKLQAGLGNSSEAIVTYEKGMAVAKAQNDRHAYSELQGALEELTDD